MMMMMVCGCAECRFKMMNGDQRPSACLDQHRCNVVRHVAQTRVDAPSRPTPQGPTAVNPTDMATHCLLVGYPASLGPVPAYARATTTMHALGDVHAYNTPDSGGTMHVRLAH